MTLKNPVYSKCSKISNSFLFLFSSEMLVFKSGQVAYQIKGNDAYNSMLVSILPLQKVTSFSFLTVVMLHVKKNVNRAT